MINIKTAGQIAYEEDVRRQPIYPFWQREPRTPWDMLPDYARWSWERSPSPRDYDENGRRWAI